jgi:hypothetical protein
LFTIAVPGGTPMIVPRHQGRNPQSAGPARSGRDLLHEALCSLPESHEKALTLALMEMGR